MADAELPHVGWPAGLPVPRPPADAGDDLPGTHREWVTALGQVSGLLCTLREAEAPDGTVVLPVPLAHGVALRAWAAVARPVRSGGGAVPVDLPPHALRLVGQAARVLGDRLCRARASGVDDLVTVVLHDEADVHGRDPEWLVAQVARVHGVLSAPDPVEARAVWHALDDAAPTAP
jgi:hypothetical protein